mmetsp:Transcript_27426/g.63883  ORF Transcript_27426/g.63883 Transcript_27426/m.63883 type:complete len:335 (+) Transcript_27426:64-1068(+)
MFLINYMEGLSFALLGYDAYQGRAKHISTQSVVALTISLALSSMNLPRSWTGKIHKLIVVFIGCCLGTLASWQVSKCSRAEGEDDLRVPGLSQRASKAAIYVGAFLMGVLSLLISCRFSPSELQTFLASDLQSPLCTFQNFLHAFALLPQLVLCRRQGFVAPAGVRFLFLLGTKHLYEFIADAYVSYKHYQRGRLSFHEFSFMFGDFVAAAILLDFLYMVITDERSVQLLMGSKEMALRDEEDPFSQEETTCSRPQWLLTTWQAIHPRLGDPQSRQQVGFCVALLLVAVGGTACGLLNAYACAAAGMAFAGYRGFVAYQASKLQLGSKAGKCCI